MSIFDYFYSLNVFCAYLLIFYNIIYDLYVYMIKEYTEK